MGLLRSRKPQHEAVRVNNVDALVVLFGRADASRALFVEDVSIYEGAGLSVISYEAPTVADLTASIASQKPGIVHLLATFNKEGSLVDDAGNELELYELMEAAEDAGVRLFVIGSENRFKSLRDYIYSGRSMSFMVITKRNRHYPTFLRAFLDGLAKDPRIAMVYVGLATQGPEWLQEGKPLPGSVALCPRNKGGSLLMRSLAQP